MNRTRVILWMTAGVGAMLLALAVLALGAWPPWPVLACFAVSHIFFCIVIWTARPFRGPYVTPMLNSDDRDT